MSIDQSAAPLADVDRRAAALGPPTGVPDRRHADADRRTTAIDRRGEPDRRHRTRSGLIATDAMKVGCPYCGGSESAVVRVRGLIHADAIRRIRECASCGERFPTAETVDRELLEQQRGTTPSGDDLN